MATSMTRRATGATLRGTGALQTSVPSSTVDGDLCILITGSRGTGDTLATPSGWTLLSSTANQAWLKIFGRYFVTGMSWPSIDWSNANWAWAQTFSFYGDVWPNINTIVHAAIDSTGTAATPIVVGNLTVTEDNCFLIACGQKFKTATSDGADVSIGGGYTGLGTESQTGTVMVAGKFYKQQTSAASDNNSITVTGTSESGSYAGARIALRTGGGSVAGVRTVRTAMMNQ